MLRRYLVAAAALAWLASASAAAAADPWAPLRRPLRLPHLAAGSPCQVTHVTRPSRQRGLALGDGPAYPVGLGRSGTLFAPFPGRPSQPFFPSEWSGQKVLWSVALRYRGSLLVRGRQLDGHNLVRFAM